MRIGAHIIGQTPRPDLLALLDGLTSDVIVRGALDDGMVSKPPSPVHAYPLTTRLRDGTLVTVDQATLEPLIQRQIHALDREGVDAHILLCAGSFPNLTSEKPLIHPFRLASRALRALGVTRLAVFVPIDGQLDAADHKFRHAGFEPEAHVFRGHLSGATREYATGKDALVFDYVGLDHSTIKAVRSTVSIPVVDLGHLAVAALRSLESHAV